MPDRRLMVALVACAALTTGCRLFRPVDPSAPRPTPAREAEERAAPRQASVSTRETGPLRDANLAAMLLALNNTDISYARLVASRTVRDDVKQFADRMLADHTGINAFVTRLLEKLDLGPEDNRASLELRDESATGRDLMRDLSGFAFDSTYIDNEVRYHKRFLATLDNVMLPAARNEEMRTLLSTVRPAVAAHLAHAEQLWANVMARR